MTRRRKERAASNSMSCTDDEWVRIRAAAAAAGEGIGRHVVRRCLTDDSSPNAKPRASQALSPEEQRSMHDAILGLSGVKPDPAVPEHPELWMLRDAVETLFRKRVAAMRREGRTEELRALLRKVLGEDEGPVAAECLVPPDGETDAG